MKKQIIIVSIFFTTVIFAGQDEELIIERQKQEISRLNRQVDDYKTIVDWMLIDRDVHCDLHRILYEINPCSPTHFQLKRSAVSNVDNHFLQSAMEVKDEIIGN